MGQGHSLPESTRAFFEARLGYDFSRVQVHTDVRAKASARALQASSYTVGQDIVFGAGQFSPHTAQGQQLLAHELTHVVQQGRNTNRPSRLVSNPKDAAEIEAAHVGASILAPLSEDSAATTVRARSTAAVQRQARPGAEFFRSPPPEFGPGAVRAQPLRFGIGRRTGLPVTNENLINWAFELAGAGVPVADMVRSLTSSYDFAGGSPEDRQRFASVLRDWEPELSAYRQAQLRQQRAAELKAIADEIDRMLFQERMQQYPGRVEIRKYPVLTFHAAVGSIVAPLLPIVEILIGFIPVLGQAVAVIEAVSGRGLLTGRKLSAAERGISALFAAIPAAGKLIRAGKSAASAIVHIAGKTRQLPHSVLRLADGLDNAAAQARLVEEAMGIAARGGTLTAQHQQALQSTLKALKEARITPSPGAASAARQGGEATTAVRQSEQAASAGRQAPEPAIGAAPDVPVLVKGAEKLYQSKKFKDVQRELQPIVDAVNPCQGSMNCVPVSIAMDRSLAMRGSGKAFRAPVTLERTGVEEVATRTGPLKVSLVEEVAFTRSTLEANIRAKMRSTGARGLFQELNKAGDGARAIIVQSGEKISHAYNVINWRGMLIAVDGQSRTIRPFADLFAQMVKTGDDWAMTWYRTH